MSSKYRPGEVHLSMNIRMFLKKSEALIGLVHDCNNIFLILKRPQIWLEITKYINSNSVRKLAIGSPNVVPDGWLAVDKTPEAPGVLAFDAARRFPIDDCTFDYIHSEHMIEHISWHDGLFMLKECRRILRPGGVVRIATPNLETLSNLYASAGTASSANYIRWVIDEWLADITLDGKPVYLPGFVINNAHRNFEHKFLYDRQVLELTMREAGFVDIRICVHGESSHECLRDVECHTSPEWRFETMVLEGTLAQIDKA